MHKKGFTLTEMMVVLIIISGLMFLLIPNLNNTKSNVDEKTCDAYVQLVNAQIQQYLYERETLPPDLDTLVTEGFIQSTSCPNGEVLILTNGEATRPILVTP